MRKNVLQPYHLISSVSMAADITSAGTSIDYLDNIGIEISWSGSSPRGTFYIQGTISETIWENLNLGYALTVAADTGKYLINLNQVPYKKLRVFWDFTSGTGTAQAYIMGKMV